MTRFALASDLHMEFGAIPDTFFSVQADCLLLAGDVVEIANTRRFLSFWERCSSHFENTYMVCGNHEFYRRVFPTAIDKLRKMLAPYPNIHVLEKQKVMIGNVRLLATTMWTDMNGGHPLTMESLRGAMNDYNSIRVAPHYRPIKPIEVLAEHRVCRAWLENALREHTEVPTVVMTHHAPTVLSIDPAYKDDYHLNGGYYSRLEDIILDNDNIATWVHGHVHQPNDYEMGNARVICNPRGYEHMFPNPDYIPCIFDVG